MVRVLRSRSAIGIHDVEGGEAQHARVSIAAPSRAPPFFRYLSAIDCATTIKAVQPGPIDQPSPNHELCHRIGGATTLKAAQPGPTPLVSN
jgi:hypothetical protein